MLRSESLTADQPAAVVHRAGGVCSQHRGTSLMWRRLSLASTAAAVLALVTVAGMAIPAGVAAGGVPRPGVHNESAPDRFALRRFALK